MNKKWYFTFGLITLMLIAPYAWLILDILDKAGYNKLLIDALFAGPCLLLTEVVWMFVGKIRNVISEEDGLE